MRLLHTSDWHLGRGFHGTSLLAEQAAYLDHVAAVVRSERVDAVLVAGDVYDRALPGPEAVELLSHGLSAIRAAGAQVVLISGNHDSPARLGFAADILAAGGVHVCSDVRRSATPVLLGEGADTVAVYGIPYLEPDLVRHHLGADVGRSHEAVLSAALGSCRADLSSRQGIASVVLAHAFVRGGEASESERDISVGGVADVPAGVFDGFGYAALGHLHGRQQLAEGAVRYSGSPLAYSFSEARHLKGGWLLEAVAGEVRAVGFVEAPAPRPLATVTGTLEELLTSSEHAEHERSWVSVVLTDRVRPLDPMTRLQQRFPHAVCLEWRPAGGVADLRTYRQRVTDRSPLEVVEGFLHHVRGVEVDAAERRLLSAAVDEARTSDAEPPVPAGQLELGATA